jgi:lipopolysaccharide export system protein LptA
VLSVWRLDAEALSTDREQQIVIEADAAEADNRKQVTIYRGDVIITQGTMKITGDTVWIYYDDSNSITKLVSVGKPAHFRQLPDDKDDFLTADADRMEYYADKDVIVMRGNARYGQGSDRITAEHIIYDSLNGRMKAESTPDIGTDGSTSGGEDKKERVIITITPKKK